MPKITQSLWWRRHFVLWAKSVLSAAIWVLKRIKFGFPRTQQTTLETAQIAPSRQLLRLWLYEALPSIFFNPQSGAFDRLEEPAIYRGSSNSYRHALGGLDQGQLGKYLVQRNVSSLAEKQKVRERRGPRVPAKILMATRSWHFAEPLFARLSGHPHTEIVRYDLNDYDDRYLKRQGKALNKVRFFRKEAEDTVINPENINAIQDYSCLTLLESKDLTNIKEADIILVDWLNHNALWALTKLPLGKKVVVRVHSYEVFSMYPMLLDFGRIDGLIFISEGIKRAFFDVWGWLIPWNIPVLVTDNIRSHSRITGATNEKQLPKTFDGAPRSKTLGMLQYHQAVKDLGFALDVFDVLIKADPEYKLILGGKTLDTLSDEGSKQLKKRFGQFPENSIVEYGYLDDVAPFFRSVGFILSTSIREGSHETVIEGMACGCVPVIRNWPLLKPFEGAQHAFPNQPNFDTVEQMAGYIERMQPEFNFHSAQAAKNAKRYFAPWTADLYADFLGSL